jgi:hypothetical protein
MVFIPPYSPDFNPIEESFSACAYLSFVIIMMQIDSLTVKAYLRANYRAIYRSEHPQHELYEACATITGAQARGWFRNSGYLM